MSKKPDCQNDIFTRICEDHKHLVERYMQNLWRPGPYAEEEPVFLDILGFIAWELTLAADSLQSLVIQDWGTIEDPNTETERNRFRALSNLVSDKAHDLQALHTFAYETMTCDPIILHRVKGEALPVSCRQRNRTRENASESTVN